MSEILTSYNNKMNRYIIWAPPYEKSNGVRSLYSLYKLLENEGCSVFIFCTYPQELTGYKVIDSVTSQMQKDDIVIYPETVWGNPLQFEKVVRWVLYYPGKNGGTKKYHSSEMIFTWDEKFYSGVPVLFLSGVDRSLFYDAHLPKTQNCYFVHKRGKWKKLRELDQCVQITMKYPSSRQELVHLLQTTDTLYSYDDCSALLEEAFLCGAKVKIITEDGFINYKPNNVFSPQLLEKQLKEFIDKTQKMSGRQPERFYLPKRLQRISKKLRWYEVLSKMTHLEYFKRKKQAYVCRLKQYGYKFNKEEQI